jgi:hypothetical protein
LRDGGDGAVRSVCCAAVSECMCECDLCGAGGPGANVATSATGRGSAWCEADVTPPTASQSICVVEVRLTFVLGTMKLRYAVCSDRMLSLNHERNTAYSRLNLTIWSLVSLGHIPLVRSPQTKGETPHLSESGLDDRPGLSLTPHPHTHLRGARWVPTVHSTPTQCPRSRESPVPAPRPVHPWIHPWIVPAGGDLCRRLDWQWVGSRLSSG